VNILDSCSDYTVFVHIFAYPLSISDTSTKRTLDSIHFITPYHTLYDNLSLIGGRYRRRIRSPSGRHPTIDRCVRNSLEGDVLSMYLDSHATYLDEQVVRIQSGYGSRDDVFPSSIVDDVWPSLILDDVLPSSILDDVLPSSILDDVLPSLILDDVLPSSISMILPNSISMRFCRVQNSKN
jgi:hypothetical protein